MDGFTWREFIAAGGGAFVALFTAIILFILNRRKQVAEIALIHAQTGETEARANEISSTILLRELDRLAQINNEQFEICERQKEELRILRLQVLEYAEKERRHARVEFELREEIDRLRQNLTNPMGPILNAAFPLDLPHESNEFDPTPPGKEDDESQ